MSTWFGFLAVLLAAAAAFAVGYLQGEKSATAAIPPPPPPEEHDVSFQDTPAEKVTELEGMVQSWQTRAERAEDLIADLEGNLQRRTEELEKAQAEIATLRAQLDAGQSPPVPFTRSKRAAREEPSSSGDKPSIFELGAPSKRTRTESSADLFSMWSKGGRAGKSTDEPVTRRSEPKEEPRAAPVPVPDEEEVPAEPLPSKRITGEAAQRIVHALEIDANLARTHREAFHAILVKFMKFEKPTGETEHTPVPGAFLQVLQNDPALSRGQRETLLMLYNRFTKSSAGGAQA